MPTPSLQFELDRSVTKEERYTLETPFDGIKTNDLFNGNKTFTFSYTVEEPDDNEYGKPKEDGSGNWTGLFGMLLDKVCLFLNLAFLIKNLETKPQARNPTLALKPRTDVTRSPKQG